MSLLYNKEATLRLATTNYQPVQREQISSPQTTEHGANLALNFGHFMVGLGEVEVRLGHCGGHLGLL